MPPSQCLLQLRSNAPGLPGPFLEENLAPYRLFDALGKKKLRVVLAIGDQVKSQCLMRTWSLLPRKDRSVAIAALEDDSLLLDCSIHLQRDAEIPRVLGGPRRGDFNLHLLKDPGPGAVKIAFSIYFNILSSFSDVVLIFVPDFGGLTKVVEFLCLWLKNTMKNAIASRPHIVLLDHRVPEAKEVWCRIFASFTSCLQRSDPTSMYTPMAIKQIMGRCFQIQSLPIQGSIRETVKQELQNSSFDRISRGLDFRAHHGRTLLQAAVRQYAEGAYGVFDPIVAARAAYPLPELLMEHISLFLNTHVKVTGAEIGTVASALMLDAYPRGMHRRWPCSGRRL